MRKNKKWIIACVIVLFLCIVLIRKDLKQKEVIFNGVLINQFLETETIEQIESGMLTALGGDAKTQEVYLDGAMSIDLSAQDPNTMMNMGKITTYVFAKELDFMIVSPDIAEHYGTLNGLANLPEILSDELTADLSQNNLFFTDKNGLKCGLDLSGSTFAEKYKIEIENPIFCMVNNSPNTDKAEKIIEWIYE